MDAFRETVQRKLLIYLMFYELMVSRKYISLFQNTQITDAYVYYPLDTVPAAQLYKSSIFSWS